MPGFVDPVLVDDDCSDEAAELDQRMPVPAIACQARSFDRKHSTGPALADCGQQAFKARAADARAGTAQIVVDDRDLLPAELTRAIGQSVLAAAAFVIVQQLIRRRLADINKGAACQMLRHDLCHRASPASLAPVPPLPLSPTAWLESGEPGSVSDRLAPPPGDRRPRTNPFPAISACASSATPSALGFERKKSRSESTSIRRSRRCSSGRRGFGLSS